MGSKGLSKILFSLAFMASAGSSVAFADCGPNAITRKFKAKATAYYPDDSPLEGGFVDRIGKPLQTLQMFLKGDAKYVSVAMDKKTFKYGTKLYIPELNKKFGKMIVFRVVDTGSAFKNKGTTRLDICVDNYGETLQPEVNSKMTLIYCEPK